MQPNINPTRSISPNDVLALAAAGNLRGVVGEDGPPLIKFFSTGRKMSFETGRLTPEAVEQLGLTEFVRGENAGFNAGRVRIEGTFDSFKYRDGVLYAAILPSKGGRGRPLELPLNPEDSRWNLSPGKGAFRFTKNFMTLDRQYPRQEEPDGKPFCQECCGWFPGDSQTAGLPSHKIDLNDLFAIVGRMCDASGGRVQLVRNEQSENDTPETVAAEFLKLDGKRLGRDIRLYNFLGRVAGEQQALLHLLEEVASPLSTAIPAAYEAIQPDLIALGERVFEPEMHADWRDIVATLGKNN